MFPRDHAKAHASGLVDEAADLISRCIQEHADLALKMNRATSQILDDLLAGKLEPIQVNMYRGVMAGAAQNLDAGRSVAGLKPGQASSATDTIGDAPIRIEQRRLEPFQIAVDEKGRMIREEEAS